MSGGVAISAPTAQSMTIQQSTANAIVNWQGFSIGEGASVDIRQPSAAAAILNRVTSSTPSTIAGQLTANGQVYLVNPNGIAITSTGVVKAAGFVASSLDIGNEDFLKGKRTFAGSGASAAVSNAGTIAIDRGGYAALIGGTVANSGTITAPLGKVGLGSGEMATIDLAGDGFLQVAVPTAANGKTALIHNSGTIKAHGGRIVMTAATAHDAARNAINISGVVEARTIGGRTGAIVIGGGPGGDVAISGRVAASGRGARAGGSISVSGRAIDVSGKLSASGAHGGAIAIAAQKGVAVSGRLTARGFDGQGGKISIAGADVGFAGARLNASGAKGGGTINARAAGTIVADAATKMKANAAKSGDGGAIALIAGGVLNAHGAFEARGGALGGNGGKIETSGAHVDFAGIRVDASAPRGAAGTWLIDPTNITIDAAAAAAIEAGLATTNVTVATPAAGPDAGDIAIAAAISWASAQGLTLDAAHAIEINAPIDITGAGKLTLKAATDPEIPTLALLSFGNGASVRYTGAPNSGQALTINGLSYTLLYSMADVQNVNNNLAGNYALAKPLDAGGTTYTGAVIAQAGAPFVSGPDDPSIFQGVFEGLGNKISNLTIGSPYSMVFQAYQGLFGTVGSHGLIAHLGLAGGSVSGAYAEFGAAGALAGSNYGVISQTYSTAAVSGQSNYWANPVGGLVGENHGTITRSYATGEVTGYTYAGGLVGLNAGGSVTHSYATGAVSGFGNDASWFATANAGGLIGRNFQGAVTDSYATGAVSSVASAGIDSYAGGLVGRNDGAVLRSYATGAVSGSGDSGGLIGLNSASIAQSHATGAVSGDSNVGGLAGTNDVGASISESYATGAVTGSFASNGLDDRGRPAGGLVGENFGAITRSYATGAVVGLAATGGLVGALQSGSITKSYATGDVTGASASTGRFGNSPTVGGLVGINYAGSVAQSYATGKVSSSINGDSYSSTSAGGLIGYNHGSITQSYATGAVSGSTGYQSTTLLGGLVGRNDGSITESYATGKVPQSSSNVIGGDIFAGGLVGSNTGSVKNSYWDKITTGQTQGGALGATGLVTSQFFNPKTFAGWAFGTTPGGSGWVIVDLGGTLNNAGGQAGGTRPFLLSEYSTNIVNAHQLQLVALAPKANYTLGANIDLGQALTNPSEHWYTPLNAPVPVSGFNPLGQAGNEFAGTFDGQGHTIANLTIGRTTYAPYAGYWASYNVGLFGYVGAAGVIENVNLAGGSVTGYDRVGMLVGKNHGLVRNSSATGATVTGQDHVGGLVGWSHGTVANSSASGAVSGVNYVGGLVGQNDNLIDDGAASGTVSGFYAVGGLAGLNGARITASTASAKVKGFIDVGGLVGENARGSIKSSQASGAVNATYYTGGLIGYNGASSIVQSSATGAVNGGDYAGGLVGYNSAGSSIADSFAKGAVNGLAYVGGLAGRSYGAIAQTSAAGGVTGFLYVGGLVGDSGSSITRSYATGAVAGNSYIGGLSGYNSGAVANSYATGAVSGVGYIAGLVGVNGLGATIAQSYATGASSGYNDVGGLVGYNALLAQISESYAEDAVRGAVSVGGLVARNVGAITQSYANGSVYGSYYAGGLVGYNGGAIAQSYATGPVGGVAYAGALVGVNAGVVTSSYWDKAAAGQSAGAGGVFGGSFAATGLTTAQLKANLPASFDPTVWAIAPGVAYPYLKSLGPTQN